MKSIIPRHYFAILISVIFGSCSTNSAPDYYKLQGFAQGSTYSISYSWGDESFAMDSAIEKLLHDFNNSLSNYDSSSIISKANKHDSSVVFDDWFVRFYEASKQAYDISGGGFDITVAPIVNLWGFGYKNGIAVDTSKLDSLRRFVGMDKISFKNGKLSMPKGMSLISNAIAQGLSVDIVSEYFDSLGIDNYLVEIGGELRTKGVNPSGKVWTVGIDKPLDTLQERQLQAAVQLHEKALATSGNYRKFYEKDGIKYSHTIDPRTGYPVRHSLLSATVIADNCALADAYATACMVNGSDWAKQLAATDSTVDILLISSGTQGKPIIYASKHFPEFIEY